MMPLLVLAAASGFQVIETGGSWWFRSPAGEAFLSNGVCCVNRGLTREEWNPLNPGFASHRLYPSEEAWATSAGKTLRQFGFNTIGAWSDHEQLKGQGLYQTPVLHLSAAGIPWVDPWSPKAEAEAYEVARRQISVWKKIPGVIGYFSDNELGWWYGALFEWTWKGEPGSPGRKKASDHFETAYGTWENLLKDFDPEGASTFAELADRGRLFLRPGGNGLQTVRTWLAQTADRYYSLSRRIIKDLHPEALYLGDRYISGYYPEVAKAAGPHVDVLSTNLNADWPQGVFAPYFLQGLRDLAKKPILITEYYSAAMQNQSGNMNDSSGFPTLATQKEREASFRRQTEFLLRQPDVLGVHWFQYYDEPRHGRHDGENYNFGLIDIEGRPYEGLARAGRKALRPPRKRTADQPNPQKTIPWIAPEKGRRLENWPHWQAVMPRTSGEPRGDFFMAWNESGLYGAIYWNEDRFFEAFYRDGKTPSADLGAFELKAGGETLVKAALGDPGGPQLEGANLLDSGTGVRSWVVFRLHASRLKRAKLEPGVKLPFTAKLTTRGRLYTLEWGAEYATQAKSHRP
jgi:hypothetical protein